jgi:hypothetical protein
LKTVNFKEIIVLGNFLPWLSAICVFFAVFYLLQDGGSELLFSDGGGDPLHALLEDALISLLRRNKRPLV